MYTVKFLDHTFLVMSALLNTGSLLEESCFLLCNTSAGSIRTSLIVDSVIAIDELDYACHARNRISIKPSKMLAVARLAQKKNQSILMIHTHPKANDQVVFSNADDIGNVDTFKFFNRMNSQNINGCLVFNKNLSAVCGRIYSTPHQWDSIKQVSIFSRPTFDSINVCVEGSTTKSNADTKFCRQELLLGSIGQKKISNKTVGIIGAGGIGSLASSILAHSSNCHIIQFDGKHVREHNNTRLIGGYPEHVTANKAKVDIACEYATRVNPNCTFTALPFDIEDTRAQQYLKDLDVIICGTDTAHSRAFLNAFCQQHLIPILDLGVEFTCSTHTGKLVSEVGRINFVQPGSACLECCALIDRDKLAFETACDAEKDQLIKDGYIKGGTEPEPSMMIFNMEVVARGMQRLIGYFTGLIPDDSSTYESFSFIGTNSNKHHRIVSKRKKQNCPYCDLKESQIIGLGDCNHPILQSI